MKTRWYKNAVVYQVYPFSFCDDNNDGWGDIQGIIGKLDYIRDLGVTAIWFSPLYKSPDYDYGYDIADYYQIDEKFGTMADFDQLLEECHKRGLKVIMDMVINHTSIEHPWFRKAIEDPGSKYRNYYIIRKGRIKGNLLIPPTNWTSTFTGSAWERIGNSDEYYLHLFCKEQADLNWEEPELRKEIVQILRFWLDKGVDGFRFDVFNMFSKVYPFEDDLSRSFQKGAPFFIDGPRMHEFLRQLNDEALSLYDSFSVGESYHPDPKEALEYVKEENNELDAIFDFAHLDADNIGGLKFFKKPFDLRQFKKGLFGPQIKNYGSGWNTLVLENHDNPRCIDRFGIDSQRYHYEAATMLATITYLGFGTPFIYMGQEAGQRNAAFQHIDQLKDPVSHFVHDLMTAYGMPKKLAFRFISYGARDHSRIPLRWDDSPNGGFNKGHEPWQISDERYKEYNVAKDLSQEHSIYRYYQKLLKIKKEDETAIYGNCQEYDHDSRKIVAYSREHENGRLFVLANFSKHKTIYELPDKFKDDRIILHNYDDVIREGTRLNLRPYEAIVFRKTA